MATLTRQDIVAAVGPLDDLIIAQIIALGTTPEELAEAQAWLVNDEPLMNTGRPLPGGRVGQVIELIASAQEDEDALLEGRRK